MRLNASFAFVCTMVAVLGFLPNQGWAARDAAFLDPGAAVSKGSRSDEAIIVEPKNEVELGETPLNVGRRATFFFVNQGTMPVQIETIAANGDSNVRAEIVVDDCSKEKRILAGSRCSITIEATPTSAGSWSAEVLLTHNAAGRIARARALGKTSAVAGDKREMGLSLNTKEAKPVDFGEVEVGTGKAVRTALMVNDSSEIISLLSIELIAPDNGLIKMDQGCSPDMDLKMGESCPITLLWKPEAKSNISTDLIIRHSGRLGFAVIPVRGMAKDITGKDSVAKGDGSATRIPAGSSAGAGGKPGIPMSPTADELDKMISGGKIPPVSAEDLPMDLPMPKSSGAKGGAASVSSSFGDVYLIGTVGNRALIYKSDGTTTVVANGEDFDLGDGKTAKMVNISPKEAEILIEGKSRVLRLQSVSALTNKAAQVGRDRAVQDSIAEKRANLSKSQNGAKDSSMVPLPIGK